MFIRKTDNSPAYFFSITYMCFFVKWEFLSPTGQRMPDEIGRKEYGRNRIPVAERLILFPCPVPCAVMMAICPMRSALRLFHLFT